MFSARAMGMGDHVLELNPIITTRVGGDDQSIGGQAGGLRPLGVSRTIQQDQIGLLDLGDLIRCGLPFPRIDPFRNGHGDFDPFSPDLAGKHGQRVVHGDDIDDSGLAWSGFLLSTSEGKEDGEYWENMSHER